MFALERVLCPTLYLKVDERGEVAHFLFHRRQSHQSVEFFQAVGVVNGLRAVVWHVALVYGHQLVVAQRREVVFLQSLRLQLADGVKQLPHCPSVGEVLVAVIVEVFYHLHCLVLCLRREDIFLVVGKGEHDLEQLRRIIVVDIEEIVEAALKSGIDAEQVVHLHPVASHDAYKLATVVLHALHEFLQSLRSLLVALSCLVDGCKGVSLIYKEYSTHCLVAEAVNLFWSLSLIWAHHLGAVHLHHMSAVEVSYCREYLS